jgi:peptidoglycan/LPS O-acetylase OafA/YrhL
MSDHNFGSNNHRIFGLDVMRAVAIMMVLCSHALWLVPKSDTFFSDLLALLGFFGVEIFFVLSGFLIGRILYNSYLAAPFRLSGVWFFLKRRWFRTLPNYLLLLLINILLAAFIGYDIAHMWRYFVFMQNFGWPMTPFFPESWSLSVEETAYLSLPLFLWMFSALTARSKSAIFLLTVLFLLCCGFIFKINYHLGQQNNTLEQWNLSLKAVVIYRFDAIVTGVLFSWLSINYNQFWNRFKWLGTSMGLAIVFFLSFGIGLFGLEIEHVPVFWNVFYLPLTSVAFACFLPVLSQWTVKQSRFTASITFVAVISYAMYLLHYGVVLQLLKHFCSESWLHGTALFTVVAVYFMLTFVLGFILYRWYEKPLTDLRDRI